VTRLSDTVDSVTGRLNSAGVQEMVADVAVSDEIVTTGVKIPVHWQLAL
jgi:hypothetical protein